MKGYTNNKKIIIAITGASGAVYGIRLLTILGQIEYIETHLIISKAGLITINHETNYTLSDIKNLATYYHHNQDITASIASGSFKQDGMVIAPCSMNTLATVACSIENNLISRVANVCLKERRKLILLCREFPLHAGQLEHMLALTNRGAIIAPPVVAFYHQPQTINDIVDHTVYRTLDLLDIHIDFPTRWVGINN